MRAERILRSLTGLGLLVGAAVVVPVAQADPGYTMAEQRYLASLYPLAHPSVTDARLVELGNLTCAVRRGGSSTNEAKAAVMRNLDTSGVLSSNAEIGTLVHVAVDNLCPEVGYP